MSGKITLKQELADSLQERARLEAENAHMRTAIFEAEELLEDQAGRPEGERLSKGITAILEENRKLREALDRYANRANWASPSGILYTSWCGGGNGFAYAEAAITP